MKKIVSIMMAATMLFSVTACGNEVVTESAVVAESAVVTESTVVAEEVEESVVVEKESYKVAVLIPGPVGYFTAVKKGIDEAALEHGIEIEYADAQWDASKQLSQAEDYITKGVDAIALCSVDSGVGEKITASSTEAGVPIIAFTNAIGNEETGEYAGLVSYIGQNEVNTGAVTGEIAIELLGEEGGKAILIEGVPGTTPQVNRKKGLEQALEGSKVEIVYNQTSNWEKEQALKIVEDLIQSKEEFDIIICQDDNSATGAGQALEEAGIKDQVKVVGLGGSIDGLAALSDGRIDGTTFMSAFEEGKETINVIKQFLDGEEVSTVTEMKQVQVTAENVDTFVGEW